MINTIQKTLNYCGIEVCMHKIAHQTVLLTPVPLYISIVRSSKEESCTQGGISFILY